MTGRSFQDIDFSVEDDALRLLYCAYLINAPLSTSYDLFKRSINAKPKILRRAMADMMAYNENTAQFTMTPPSESATGVKPEIKVPSVLLGDVVARLVVSGGLDAHYAMREMTISDMMRYVKALDDKHRQQMEAQRLWTFLTILPHIDKKSAPTPQKLYPFAWELEEMERKAQAEIEKNKETLEKFMSGELIDINKIKWNTPNGK